MRQGHGQSLPVTRSAARPAEFGDAACCDTTRGNGSAIIGRGAYPFGAGVVEYRGMAIGLGPVAQRLEQATHNRLVAGSNPAGPSRKYRGWRFGKA